MAEFWSLLQLKQYDVRIDAVVMHPKKTDDCENKGFPLSLLSGIAFKMYFRSINLDLLSMLAPYLSSAVRCICVALAHAVLCCTARPLLRNLVRSGGPAAAMSPETAVELLRFCFADLWDPGAPPVESQEIPSAVPRTPAAPGTWVGPPTDGQAIPPVTGANPPVTEARAGTGPSPSGGVHGGVPLQDLTMSHVTDYLTSLMVGSFLCASS